MSPADRWRRAVWRSHGSDATPLAGHVIMMMMMNSINRTLYLAGDRGFWFRRWISRFVHQVHSVQDDIAVLNDLVFFRWYTHRHWRTCSQHALHQPSFVYFRHFMCSTLVFTTEVFLQGVHIHEMVGYRTCAKTTAIWETRENISAWKSVNRSVLWPTAYLHFWNALICYLLWVKAAVNETFNLGSGSISKHRQWSLLHCVVS